MMYALFADNDLICAADTRGELREIIGDADFQAWAKSAGYADVYIHAGCGVYLDSVDLRSYYI